MMDMSMGMNLLPQQQMKASPALIALNNMLVLSTQDLQQLVQSELEENPALDQIESEESLCSRCGRPLSGATCIYCLHEDLKLAESERDDAAAAPTDDDFDPLLAVAAPHRCTSRFGAICTSAYPRTTTRSPIIWFARSTNTAFWMAISKRSPP